MKAKGQGPYSQSRQETLWPNDPDSPDQERATHEECLVSSPQRKCPKFKN